MLPVRLPKRFEFVRELGRGGMGAVYEVFDTEKGAHVAIKTLPSHDPLAIARFKREFRALQDLHHPNLVSLGELFCEEGEWAFSMDLIEGTDLIDYLRPSAGELDPSALSREGGDGLVAPLLVCADTKSLEPVFAPLPPERPSKTVLAVPMTAPQSPSSPSSPLGPARLTEAQVERLRDAFAQLAKGLAALHEANKIHRDIKPSNIRVRRDGQVFLLDFGLVTELASEARLTGHQNVLGTPAYMAPEQASGGTVGTPADWYAVGVVLFEALTGSLPFEGTAMQMMMAKQRGEAPRVRTFEPDVPSDLDELSARLLDFDPSKRPSAQAILRALRPSVHASANARDQGTYGSVAPPFVGRSEQLRVLQAAFGRVLDGEPAAVLLEGESGTGKSYLARRFLDRLLIEHPKTVVVAGRCYENETVPYNAWDGAIESLAAYWMRLESTDAAALRPVHIAPLAQTFPALRRVPTVARTVSRKASTLDPREIRSRAFAGLRDLLERASQRTPLVVFLDDIQWADHDSVSLLGEVLREPSPPPFLLVATARPLQDYPDADAALRDALPRGAIRVGVSHLAHADAVELAAELLARQSVELVGQAESVASEAGGHALFIAELVRQIGAAGRVSPGSLSLSDALWSRVQELDPAARSLLTVLALARRPLREAIALRAARVDANDGPRVLSALRVGHLTRTTRLDGTDWTETYHDRVREAVFARIDVESRTSVFERIAEALEGEAHPDPNLLTEIWKAAGNIESAGHYARIAGDKARDALAFDRAAGFYRTALERPTCGEEERHELLVTLGDTLATAGRGREAADAFQEALATAKGGIEALGLERKSCQQLLRTGHHDAGVASGKRLVAMAGISWPKSALQTVIVIVLLRIFLRLRGTRFRERSAASVGAETAVHLDVLRDLGHWLTMHDPLRASAFQLRHLRAVLQHGDITRVSEALSATVARDSMLGGSRSPRGSARAREQLVAAEAIAARANDPFASAFCNLTAGAGLVLGCRAGAGAGRLLEAERAFREEFRGATWEVIWARVFICRAYFYVGDFGALVRTQASALQEAIDQRDLFGITHFRLAFCSFAWLLRDEPTTAREALEDAFREFGARPFALEHHWALATEINNALYGGDAGPAIRCIDQSWVALRRSLLRQMLPTVRCQSSEYRARAHIAFAMQSAANRSEQLASARTWVRDMEHSDVAYAPSMADLLRAQIAVVEGNESRAVALLRRGLPALVAMDLHGYAAVARRALGTLLKGDEGASLVAASDEFLNGHNVKNLSALCRCMAPGFAGLA